MSIERRLYLIEKILLNVYRMIFPFLSKEDQKRCNEELKPSFQELKKLGKHE